MDLTTMTEAEFLCEPDNCHAADHEPTWETVRFQTKRNTIGPKVADGPCGYTIHQFGKGSGDVVACNAGEPVGIYYSQILSVNPAHARRGVATAMILAAVINRTMPTARYVSKAGEAALRSAWRVANR